MKKHLLALGVMVGALLVGCNKKSGGEIEIPQPKVSGYYILGEGDWGKNNSTLYYYNLDTKELTNRFEQANPGKILGDNANDMKLYGTKLYVAVNASNKVVVLNAAEGRILQEIEMGLEEGKNREPRAVACAAGKVFVSLYSGQVARIDTANYNVDYTPYGGQFKYSEGIVAVGGDKICVANSGRGKLSTVSVYRVSDFSLESEFDVPVNPQEFAVDRLNQVYLATWGNYADIPAALHKLDLSNKTYKTIPGAKVQRIAISDDTLYGVRVEYGAEMTSTLEKVDLLSGQVTTMIGNKVGASFNGVNVNPLSGYLYVMDGTDVLCFNHLGAQQETIKNAGNRLNTLAFMVQDAQ